MKYFRLLPLLILLSPLLHAGEPRISAVATMPFTLYLGDADGDGLKDLYSPWQEGYTEPTPVIARNLGNRNFAPYTTPFFPYNRDELTDGTASFVEITPGDHRIFLSTRTSSGYSNTGGLLDLARTPSTLPLDGIGVGERTPIAPASADYWIPLDLDADHQTEFVYFTSTGTTSGTLSIMDRQADGGYTATQVPLANLSWSESDSRPYLADLDNDGDLDLVVFDASVYRNLVYRRTGPRSFDQSPAAILDTNNYSRLEFADLNGDGLPDLYSFANGKLIYFLSQPGLTFGPWQEGNAFGTASDQWRGVNVISTPGAPAVLHFIRISGMEVTLVSDRFGTWTPFSQQVVNIAPLRPHVPSGGGGDADAWVMSTDDLDLDGFPDLLIFLRVPITGYNENPFPGYTDTMFCRCAVAWGHAAGFGTPVFIDPTPVSSETLLIGNFDSQAAPDLILGPDPEGYLWFYGNAGDGTFPRRVRLDPLGRLYGSATTTTITSLRSADMDNDGIADLVVEYQRIANYQNASAYAVAKGRGDGTFHAPVLPAGSFTTVMSYVGGIDALVDWDGDGDLDIISAGGWRENTSGAFSTETRPLIGGAPLTDVWGNPILKTYSRVGDVDGDGHPDIISLVFKLGPILPDTIVGGLGQTRESTFAVAFNDGNGGIASIAEVPVTLQSTDVLGNPYIHDLQVADLNADGRPDLCFDEFLTTDILGNPVGATRWLRNPGGAAARNPASWLALPLNGPLPTTPTPQDDFDGDGRKDWATGDGYVRPSPSGPVVSASYDFARNIQFGTAWHDTRQADFDGDGDSDFLYFAGSELWVVKNTIVDEREEITRYLVAAGVPGQAAAPHADADGDGRSNLNELLMGGNPTSPDSGVANPLAVALVTSGSGNSLSFRTPGYAADLRLGYAIEHSTNLVDWQALPDASPVTVSSAGSWNFQTLDLTCTGPCGYYRLRGHQTAR